MFVIFTNSLKTKTGLVSHLLHRCISKLHTFQKYTLSNFEIRRDVIVHLRRVTIKPMCIWNCGKTHILGLLAVKHAIYRGWHHIWSRNWVGCSVTNLIQHCDCCQLGLVTGDHSDNIIPTYIVAHEMILTGNVTTCFCGIFWCIKLNTNKFLQNQLSPHAYQVQMTPQKI